jgi:threonine/homoserine/homoserine lactone efflux protein
MSPEVWFTFINFAFVSSITPGPNNFMLLASGVNHGLKASARHITGIALGFGTMIIAVGLGLHIVFDQYPFLGVLMKWIGVVYLLYLTWGIATAAAPSDDSSKTKKPMTIWGAASFQIVNVKAWIMAIGAFSTYIPANSPPETVFLVTAIFILINVPSCISWTIFGSSMRQYLLIDKYRRLFNFTMAALLLYSIVQIIMERGLTN